MRKIIVSVLAVMMALVLCSCVSPEKSIVGTWKSQNTVLGIVTETTYIFNEDGSGKLSNVLDIDFTYSFSEDKLLITTSALGIENTTEYSFAFDGNKLVLTSDSDTIELEKVS